MFTFQLIRMENSGTPLHNAAWRGDFDLVKEILEKTPELAEARDYCKRLPLHLASARGYTEIVKLLVSNDDLDMCNGRDIDGRNPLHLAAIKGRVEVLNVLVEKCPHAAEARADRGETILHFCFKYNQKEVIKSLLQNAKIQEIVNAKDEDGNTLLHLAIADQNVTATNNEIVKCLLACSNIDANATNSNGYTPLDIAIKREEELNKLKSDKKRVAEWQVNALLNEDAQTARELGRNQWVAEKRGSLMVVASLIATIAFQAGLTPPGGLLQEDKGNFRAGHSVLATSNPPLFLDFLKSNTIGFVGSLSVILLLISELPFKKKTFMWALIVIMWATISAMAVTYAYVVITVVPGIPHVNSEVWTTLGTELVVWASIMAALVLINIIRLCLNLRKVRNIKYSIISLRKKKFGFGKRSSSRPSNEDLARI